MRRVVFRIDYFQKFAYLYSHNGSKIKRVKDQRGLNCIINKYVLLIPLGRIRDISSRKILDSATRKRRQKRQLDALEKDNFQDDPHSHLTVVPAKMKVPAFNDTMEGNLVLCAFVAAILIITHLHVEVLLRPSQLILLKLTSSS